MKTSGNVFRWRLYQNWVLPMYYIKIKIKAIYVRCYTCVITRQVGEDGGQDLRPHDKIYKIYARTTTSIPVSYTHLTLPTTAEV